VNLLPLLPSNVFPVACILFAVPLFATPIFSSPSFASSSFASSSIDREPPNTVIDPGGPEVERPDPDRRESLPPGADRISLKGQTYFYSHGYFYRRDSEGYLRVEPPLGAELSFLPYGSRGFSLGDERYFLSGTGTFYRFDPRRNTFTVVTPPYEWRRYYNGSVIDAYEDELYGESGDEDDEIRRYLDDPDIPRAYPPGAIAEDQLEYQRRDWREPRFEGEGEAYRLDPRHNSGRPYADVRPPQSVGGERYDTRALRESYCSQRATGAASKSTLQDQQMRLYQRAYRDCIQQYERRR